jgi:hypothetical protein
MSKLLLLVLVGTLSISAFSDVGAPWSVEMVALDNGQTRYIKYNIYTGETWWSKNLEWKKIIDPNPVSISTYEYKVVSRGLNWRTLRIDKLTGDTWKNSNGVWTKLTDKIK